MPLGKNVPIDELKDLVPNAKLSLPGLNDATGSFNSRRSLNPTLLELKTALQYGVKYAEVPQCPGGPGQVVGRLGRHARTEVGCTPGCGVAQYGGSPWDKRLDHFETHIFDMPEYTGMIFSIVSEPGEQKGAPHIARYCVLGS
eukprot:jgi/Tetstr1/428783/TSEL_018770.t1